MYSCVFIFKISPQPLDPKPSLYHLQFFVHHLKCQANLVFQIQHSTSHLLLSNDLGTFDLAFHFLHWSASCHPSEKCCKKKKKLNPIWCFMNLKMNNIRVLIVPLANWGLCSCSLWQKWWHQSNWQCHMQIWLGLHLCR